MASGFNGWKKCDTVTIVVRKKPTYGRHVDNEILQGYIVDPSNEEQLRNARNWAKGYKIEEPIEEVSFDNSGFTLQFCMAAEKSYVTNGKLSFWNCLISKDGKQYLVGIASDQLIDVILHSNIYNGLVEEKVFFVTKSGKVGVMHENMPQYKELINDANLRKQVNAKKTSKWSKDKVYSTLYCSDVYLGDAWDWLEETKTTKGDGIFTREITEITLLKEPKPVVVLATVGCGKTDEKCTVNTSEFVNSTRGYFSFRPKLPSRAEDANFTVNVDHSEDDFRTALFRPSTEISTDRLSEFIYDRIRYTADKEYPKEWRKLFITLASSEFRGYSFKIEE